MANVATEELDNPASQFTVFRPPHTVFEKKSRATKSDPNSNVIEPSQAEAKPGQFYYVEDGMLGICWSYVIRLTILHLACAYGFYRFYQAALTRSVNPGFYYTWLWTGLLHYIAIELGVSIGSHRLWAHRAYKARTPARIILMIAETLSGQFTVFAWAWKHRVHHKWSDTDADPHNTLRGFFFVHMGWTLLQPHPEFYVKARTLDHTDLLKDPVVKFQNDFYYPFFTAVTLAAAWVPVHFWGENWVDSILFTFVIRYTLGLHATWLVNSAAHMFGARPYNAGIAAVQNLFVTFGISEGYHNYHHQYPFDYQSSEHGHGLNIGYHLINFLWWIGQAYDLRITPNEVVQRDKVRAAKMNALHKAYNSI